MPKFLVYESATTVCAYLVEADSKDKAQEIVEEGYSEPVRTKYIEREVYDVVEAGND